MAAKKKRLTTHSGTSLESLSQFTFFLDRASESKVLSEALRTFGTNVEIHRDHFAEDESDQIWLADVSARSWVIISQNQFNELERMAIRNAGGRAFLIVHGEMKAEDEARMIVNAMPEMLRILAANKAPFIARIYNARKILITSNRFRAHSKLSR